LFKSKNVFGALFQMSLRARIGGTLDFSTIDWSGKLTSMVFFAGCNFRCPYCHNADLIPPMSGRDCEVEEIIGRLEKNAGIIDAVGFTGGEPCLQGEVLECLAKRAKDIGLKVFLNTNGTNPIIVNRLLNARLLDALAMDIKAPLNLEFYGRLTGVESPVTDAENIRRIRATLEICVRKRLSLEVRTTIVPGLIECERNVKDIARECKGADIYVLQQFSPEGNLLDPDLASVVPPSRNGLIKLAKAVVGCGLKEIRIRTRERGEEKIWP
jgi:pyruvate formate lyase activating enzyme